MTGHPSPHQAEEKRYSKDALGGLPDPEIWPKFRKTTLTSAIPIDGPFTVLTSEGPLHCADGYLCIDARGYPYPVAREEFELIYEPAAPAQLPPT